MYERWNELLTYWRRVEHRHALTLSFLVGAFRDPVGAALGSDDPAGAEIAALIHAMRSYSSDDGAFHHIYRCPDIGQFVVTKTGSTYPPRTSVLVPHANIEKSPSLAVSDMNLREGFPVLPEVIQVLVGEFGEAISGGNYSCRGRQFFPFNDYELRVINKALA